MGRPTAIAGLAVKLLGTMPDASVAIRLGVVQSTVARARRRLGIPPFDKRASSNRTGIPLPPVPPIPKPSPNPSPEPPGDPTTEPERSRLDTAAGDLRELQALINEARARGSYQAAATLISRRSEARVELYAARAEAKASQAQGVTAEAFLAFLKETAHRLPRSVQAEAAAVFGDLIAPKLEALDGGKVALRVRA